MDARLFRVPGYPDWNLSKVGQPGKIAKLVRYVVLSDDGHGAF